MGSVTRRVVTFYSFKGGVGRTFALCDVAVYLARWGYRVLCVDLDLEAPGLTRYFNGWLKDDNCPGMLEVLEAWANDANDEAIIAEAIVPVDLPETEGLPGTDGRLALVKSGRGGDDYVRRLHAVDWERLFDEQRAGRRLEALRDRWLDTFDLVLIDSRTGWSDVGEICTIHLPDILVTLFTPNEQSFRGAIEVADASKRGVGRLPLDRAPLRVVPVLTRVDKDEYDEQQRWTQRLLSEASRFVGDWDPEEETPQDVLAHLVVPYVPYWSYGERLAAMRNEPLSSLSVGRAHETLAALLARGLSEATLLLRHRDSYVEGAALRSEQDVYLSLPGSEQSADQGQLFDGLAEVLRRRSLNVSLGQSVLPPGERLEDLLQNVQRRSRIFVVFFDERIEVGRTKELGVVTALAEAGLARLVPVALSSYEQIPERLRRFSGILAPRVQDSNTVRMNRGDRGDQIDVEELAAMILSRIAARQE